MKVTIERRVGLIEALKFWAIYKEQFIPLTEDAPVYQMLPLWQWLRAMFYPRFYKFVNRDANGEMVSLGVMGTRLEDFPFLSVPYFRKHHNDHYRRRALYYFITLVTKPGREGEGNAEGLMQLMAETVGRNEAIAVFDVCTANATSGLPEAIHAMAGQYVDVDPIIEFGIERYAGIPAHLRRG